MWLLPTGNLPGRCQRAGAPRSHSRCGRRRHVDPKRQRSRVVRAQNRSWRPLLEYDACSLLNNSPRGSRSRGDNCLIIVYLFWEETYLYASRQTMRNDAEKDRDICSIVHGVVCTQFVHFAQLHRQKCCKCQRGEYAFADPGNARGGGSGRVRRTSG